VNFAVADSERVVVLIPSRVSMVNEHNSGSSAYFLLTVPTTEILEPVPYIQHKKLEVKRVQQWPYL
jgi:hypothetical protein